MGRTGRKRAGVVHVLLSEGREEFNLDKAKSTYKEVQKIIWRGEQLELYGDVERLLPNHIKPECLERHMEMQEYVREDGRKSRGDGGNSPSKGTKRKRNDDVARNIPVGASTGFVSVAELLVKGAKKRKKISEPKDFDFAGQDDDTDADIESGSVIPPRRSKSTAATAGSSKSKSKLRKSVTIGGTNPKSRKKETVAEPTSSQFSAKGIDDSDDMDIELGVGVLPPTMPLCSSRNEPEKTRARDPSPLEVCTPGAAADLSGTNFDHILTTGAFGLHTTLSFRTERH